MGALIVFIVLGLPQQRDVPDYMNAIAEYHRAAALLSQEPLHGIYANIERITGRRDLYEQFKSFDLSARKRLVPRIIPVYLAVRSGNARPYAVMRVERIDGVIRVEEMSALRSVAYALLNYAEVLMADGKPNEAFKVLADVYVMGGKMAYSGNLIHILFAGANQSRAAGMIDMQLQQLSVPAAEYILANIPLPESSNDNLKALLLRESTSRRNVAREFVLSRILTGEDPVDELTEDSGRPLTSHEIDVASLDLDEMTISIPEQYPILQELVAIIDRPEDIWWQESSRILKAAGDAGSLGEYEAVVASGSLRSVLRSRTKARLLRLHAHIVKYYWTHGRLPQGLSQLNEDDATFDPVTRGRFEYELRGETYDLYSRGFGPTGPIRLSGGPPRGVPSDPDDPLTEEKRP